MIKRIKDLFTRAPKEPEQKTEIPLYLGIKLLQEGASVRDKEAAVLEFVAGTPHKGQCTAAELASASKLFEDFLDILNNPRKEVGDISFYVTLTLGGVRYAVKIPGLTSLDITFNAVEQIELLSKIDPTNMHWVLACLYAKTLQLPHIPGGTRNLEAQLATAILTQASFVDAYALFSFFFHYSRELEKTSPLPMKTFVQRYQLRGQTAMMRLANYITGPF